MRGRMVLNLIVPVSPSRLAEFAISNPKLAKNILRSIRGAYELENSIEIRFSNEIIVSVTSKHREYIASIAELPVTKIDIKAAMLQARLLWIPQKIGIDSKRAREIIATESPHITLTSMLGIEKSKASSIRLLTNYEEQERLDYIDKGIGAEALRWLTEQYGVANSRDLARVLNSFVIGATLQLASAQSERLLHIGLDDIIIHGDRYCPVDDIAVRSETFKE